MHILNSRSRNEFTDREDDYLVQYIAKYNPNPEGRTGNKLYLRLVEDVRIPISPAPPRMSLSQSYPFGSS